jgi:hypothetical protein
MWDAKAMRCANVDSERELWIGVIEKNPFDEGRRITAREKLEALRTEKTQLLSMPPSP